MTDKRLTAEEMAAAREILEEIPPSEGLLGIGDMIRVLTGAVPGFTDAQRHRLSSDLSVARTWRDLKRRISVAEIPLLAAAASEDPLSSITAGQPFERVFQGGSLRIIYDTENLYVVEVEFEGIDVDGVEVFLEAADGQVTRFGFDDWTDEDGRVIATLERSREDDRRALEALVDPRTIGFFIRRE